MAKALEPAQIQKLLRQQDSGRVPARSSVPQWPTKEDRKRLHAAATSHKKTVVFNDGREYRLKYSMQDSIAWGTHEVVFVGPISGGIPCGYFRIKAILSGGDI